MTGRIFSISIDDEHAGQRLDRMLASAVESLSRSRHKSLIESGAVSVNGEPVIDPNFRLKPASTVVLTVPDAVPDRPEPQAIPLDILFEDEHLIVLNKSAGLVVHPAAGNPDQTLVNALLAHCGDSLQGIGGVKRPGIVHRLDKDTSGLLVAAKTEPVHVGLTEQFAAHSIERRYTAMVWGVPSPISGTIEGAIGRSTKNRKKMAVVTRNGKSAVTHYRLVKAYGNTASLVECRLETGRTHQIRVHMAHAGNSIVGDPLYGRGIKRGTAKSLAEAVKIFDRQALHAGVLGFIHPTTHCELHFEAELPDDFRILQAAFETET